jgi:hypothetical protein
MYPQDSAVNSVGSVKKDEVSLMALKVVQPDESAGKAIAVRVKVEQKFRGVDLSIADK